MAAVAFWGLCEKCHDRPVVQGSDSLCASCLEAQCSEDPKNEGGLCTTTKTQKVPHGMRHYLDRFLHKR